MSYLVVKSKAVDFPSGIVPDQVVVLINGWPGITPNCTYISTFNDIVDIYFDADINNGGLYPGQLAILSAAIASYAPGDPDSKYVIVAPGDGGGIIILDDPRRIAEVDISAAPIPQSIAGTANQITASAPIGAITLSTPSTFNAPGTIQDTTGMMYSTSPTVAAAGTTQGTATPLTKSYNVATSVAAATGVRLPVPNAGGLIIVIENKGANTLSVYPATGAAIDGAATNAPVSLPVNAAVMYQAATTTQWYSTIPVLTGGAGTSIAYGNGQTTITNTGATSISGTTNQVAASPSTGAVTISTPSTFIAPGTIQDTSGLYYSTSATVTAAGTTQGTATPITKSYNVATTVPLNAGVVLPTPATSGLTITIVNKGANTLNVYPAAGGSIDALAPNSATSVPVDGTAIFDASSTTQWYSIATGGSVGVTSITGTANQITMSPSTGAVTASTPSTFIAPGTIQDTSGLLYSATTGISAAGATQGTATPLTKSYNVVSTVAAATGVRLQVPSAGYIVTIVNKGANTLNVYPATGASIDGASANVAVSLAVNASATYQAASTTQWYTVDKPIIGGTGVSITYGNGDATIANTGATSIAGTTNQITASASTGAITLSTPSTFIAPGTIQDTSGMYFSTNSAATAAGATQGTATPITKSYTVVVTVAAGTGVVLPTPTVAGLIAVIVNKGVNTLNVYPASGGAIDSAGTNTAVQLAVNASAIYEASSTAQWYTIDPPIVAGTGVAVAYGNGQTTITSTGATSISGTANQIIASASTGAITLSTPSTFIAPGTIQDTTGMYYSTNAAVSAAGATQGTATAITKSYNVATTVAASTGVALPTPTTGGLVVVIVNKGANPLNVYPAVGGAIDAAATNAPVVLPVNAAAIYQAASTTQWHTVDPPMTAGTGVSITYGNGQTTISNSGATNINGTANQITASASTGSITLSTPSTFIAPGTIQDTSGMLYSTNAAVSAAGATQGTATALAVSYNVVTTVAASTGVRLPVPSVAGLITVVVNKGANALNVYPATGGAIDAAGTNTAVQLAVNATAVYQAASTTQWYTIVPPMVAGTGTQVSYGNGQTTISNTGATSISGTANQITASASTGAITLSTPSTFIAPGTIQDTTGMYWSTAATITAAGATQGTATAITTSYNIATTVAAATGVRLPTPTTGGLIVAVVNKGANTLNVYPATGGAIDAAGTNTAVQLAVNATAIYQAASTTQWYTTDPPMVAGTGVSIAYGNGQTTITSTGATSISGTANQITASASTGAITLSTPSTFIAPGTIQDTTGMYLSTSATVTAAGATQGTATALTTSYNIATTVAAATGVRLPTPATGGLIVAVVNKGANTLNVYPASGGAIDSAGTNTAVQLAVNATAIYQAASTTQWYTIDPPMVAGTGVSVAYGNGQTSIANTGATSISGTANQITASASTGAITLSTPSTFIAPGTIQDTTGMYYSTNATVSAAGTNQGTATPLTRSYNVVTTVAASTGVALPAPTVGGLVVVVVNKGANPLNVYPASTNAIDGAGTNVAVVLAVNSTAFYQAATTTQWYTIKPSDVAGTGMTISYGNGITTYTNTGATSISGTANQITASASTGAITLSTPSTFIAPGTIQDTTGMYYSTNAAVSAAGAVQSTATAITASYNVITTVNAGTGVRLQTPSIGGLIVVIVNKGANALSVYPALGGAIDNAATNAAVSLAVNAAAIYQAASTTQWYTVDPPMTAGTGISVSYGNGQTSITNTGATSITGTTNQITASASTGAITLSTPSTFIAPGTIQDTTGMYYSTNAAVSAAGATQGTATALTASYNVATTVNASTGVRLPVPAAAGLRVVIVNKGANSLNVYPALGGTIDAASTNAAVALAVNATATYEASSASQWYTVVPPVIAGAGITATYGNGATTIATSGSSVSTWSAGTTGFTPAGATSGAVTLAGTLIVANGGTGATTLTANRFLTGNGTGTVLTTKVVPTGTVVGDTDTQTLSGKTIIDVSNIVRATQLATSGADVVISASAPPAAGYRLVATSATVAAWQPTNTDPKWTVDTASTTSITSNPSLNGTSSYIALGGTYGTGQVTSVMNVADTFTNDGVTYSSADNGTRILLKDEGGGTSTSNGIYTILIAGTALTLNRAFDFAFSYDVFNSARCFIFRGTVNANSWWMLTTANPITVGTALGTAMSFGRMATAQYLRDEGVAVTGGPHQILNFTGAGVAVANAGGGVANITIAPVTATATQATGSNSITTSSTSAVDFSTALSVTLTTGSMVLLSYAIPVSNNTNAATTTILITNSSGGTTYSTSAMTNGTAGYMVCTSNSVIVSGLTPGSNTFKGRWLVSAGTATSDATKMPRVLNVVPLN